MADSDRKLGPAGRIAVWLVLAYRASLGRWLGGHCRYHPTCSAYAIEAVQDHGALRGGWLAARRVMRCHPWGGAGYDPPPTPNDRRRGEIAERGAEPDRK